MCDLKAAIIGCGPRARGHAAGFEQASGVRCEACADIDRERADAFAAEHGLRAHYEPMEMLELEAPDIVAIVTREGPRAELTRICAEKRTTAIIAEKPMARTLDEAREMVEVCEANGTVLTVCHQMTFSREFELLRECIGAGEIGDVRFLRAVSYGQLMEQGPHLVDMVLWLREGHEVARVMGQAEDTARANETVHPAPVFSLWATSSSMTMCAACWRPAAASRPTRRSTGRGRRSASAPGGRTAWPRRWWAGSSAR